MENLTTLRVLVVGSERNDAFVNCDMVEDARVSRCRLHGRQCVFGYPFMVEVRDLHAEQDLLASWTPVTGAKQQDHGLL